MSAGSHQETFLSGLASILLTLLAIHSPFANTRTLLALIRRFENSKDCKGYAEAATSHPAIQRGPRPKHFCTYQREAPATQSHTVSTQVIKSSSLLSRERSKNLTSWHWNLSLQWHLAALTDHCFPPPSWRPLNRHAECLGVKQRSHLDDLPSQQQVKTLTRHLAIFSLSLVPVLRQPENIHVFLP